MPGLRPPGRLRLGATQLDNRAKAWLTRAVARFAPDQPWTQLG